MPRINWSDEFERFLLENYYYSQFTNLILEIEKCTLSYYTKHHPHYLYIYHISNYLEYFSKERGKLDVLDVCWRNYIRNLEQW